MCLANVAILADFLDRHFPGLDRLHPRAGDPFDVTLAKLALQQALGVADAIETEMADIGLRGDKRHRHPVANATFAQLGVQDEDELVGWTEA